MAVWIFLASLGVYGLIVWLLRRRADEVEGFYERVRQDAPAFDAGSYLGGDR